MWISPSAGSTSRANRSWKWQRFSLPWSFQSRATATGTSITTRAPGGNAIRVSVAPLFDIRPGSEGIETNPRFFVLKTLSYNTQ